MINPYALSCVLSVLVHLLVIGFVMYIRVHTSTVPMLLANTVFLVKDAGQPAAAVVRSVKSSVRVPMRVVTDMRPIIVRSVQHVPQPLHKQVQQQLLQQEIQRQLIQREIRQEKNGQQSKKNHKDSHEHTLFLQYQQALIAHIRRFVLIPFDLSSHSPVVFDVTQSRDGHVIAVRLRRSSGNVTYDRAVERAIGLANPLPVPTEARFFETHLVIRFYPS